MVVCVHTCVCVRMCVCVHVRQPPLRVCKIRVLGQLVFEFVCVFVVCD